MDDEERTVIGNNSKMSLSLMVAIGAACIGLLGGLIAGVHLCSKWATTVDNKLDEGLRNQSRLMDGVVAMDAKTSSSLSVHSGKITVIEAKLNEYEKFGTPMLQALDRRLHDLERKFIK